MSNPGILGKALYFIKYRQSSQLVRMGFMEEAVDKYSIDRVK
jgi:hypothetical protein